MSTTVAWSPDGWMLADVTAPGDQVVHYELSGLRVPRETAEAIIRRGRPLSWHRTPVAAGIVVLTMGVTWQEAHAIWHHGADPAAVLLPPLHARTLTLEELMSA